MLRQTVIWAIGLVLVAVAAAGCNPLAEPPAPPVAEVKAPEQPMVMRSYDVPPQDAGRVAHILETLLMADGEGASPGRVVEGPGGSVVVMAPEGLQKDIGAFVQDLRAKDPATRPVRTARVDYWLVVGRAAKETHTGRVSELDDVLKAITATQGPHQFALRERLSLSSLEGALAESQGRWLRASQSVASIENEAVVADLKLAMRGGPQLSTRLKLKPGQTAVLSQSGYPPNEGAALFDDLDSLVRGDNDYQLFFVARAQVE